MLGAESIDAGLGLPWLAEPLSGALAQPQSHALLIQGPAGVGQFELALALAQSWLCESPRSADAWACGGCGSCKLFTARSHPDFVLLVPDALRETLGWAAEDGDKADKGGEAKAGKAKPSREIKIDAVRRMLGFAQQTSARGRAKIVVVHPAEALNAVAANALLKTLEEPSGSLRFILSCAAPEALLPTIRSRCQPLPLGLPRHDLALDWLRRQCAPAGEGVELLLAAAGGRPQEALAWHQAGLKAADWRALPQRLARGELAAIADWPVPRAIDAMQRLCHDLMRQAQGAAPRFFPADALPGAASVRSAAALQDWALALQQAARHAEHPLNAGLLLESLVLQGQAALQQRGRARAG